MKNVEKNYNGESKMEEYKMEHGYVIINKKHYNVSHKKGKPILTQDKNAKKIIAQAKRIAKKLKSTLDAEAVLTEAILKLDKKEIQTLEKTINNKNKNYKPKTRKHHCVDMKIGNFILPIID